MFPIDRRGIPQGWSFCWCFLTDHRFEFSNLFPIIYNNIFPAKIPVNLYPIDTALRIHSRYLISIALFCYILPKFENISQSGKFWKTILSPIARLCGVFINPIVLSLSCHFQKVQNHFCSSRIGQVIKFCVDCHIFKFLATTNLDGDRELDLYYLLILIWKIFLLTESPVTNISIWIFSCILICFWKAKHFVDWEFTHK